MAFACFGISCCFPCLYTPVLDSGVLIHMPFSTFPFLFMSFYFIHIYSCFVLPHVSLLYACTHLPPLVMLNSISITLTIQSSDGVLGVLDILYICIYIYTYISTYSQWWTVPVGEDLRTPVPLCPPF